ncbi:MAG: class I SAM-dependent methyltransferase [Bacilli bacterium]
MSWYEVYLKDIEKKGNLELYVKDKIKNKKVLINLIQKYSINKKIIESGSGTGVLSTYMASLNFDAIGIDIDQSILKLSQKIAKKYNSKNKPVFLQKSIFELDYSNNEFDVSFSNGVLEHFSDEEIIKTLNQQMKIAKYVIFGIPTKYFKQREAMYGDERYMNFSFWRNLIKLSKGIILEEKSMHYMDLKHRLLNFKKYFKPYPYRIFVVTRATKN